MSAPRSNQGGTRGSLTGKKPEKPPRKPPRKRPTELLPPKALSALLAEIKTATTLAEAQKIITRRLGKTFPSCLEIIRVGFGLQWVAVQEALIVVAGRKPATAEERRELEINYTIGYARIVIQRCDRLAGYRNSPSLNGGTIISAVRIKERADAEWKKLEAMDPGPDDDSKIAELKRWAFEIMAGDLADERRHWERIWRTI